MELFYLCPQWLYQYCGFSSLNNREILLINQTNLSHSSPVFEGLSEWDANPFASCPELRHIWLYNGTKTCHSSFVADSRQAGGSQLGNIKTQREGALQWISSQSAKGITPLASRGKICQKGGTGEKSGSSCCSLVCACTTYAQRALVSTAVNRHFLSALTFT